MIFELNLYELAHKSYGLFSNDMQKHMKLISVRWWQTVRNGHIITLCVYPVDFWWRSKDSLNKSESVHINLLEEPEKQELRLQLDGTHEGDC